MSIDESDPTNTSPTKPAVARWKRGSEMGVPLVSWGRTGHPPPPAPTATVALSLGSQASPTDGGGQRRPPGARRGVPHRQLLLLPLIMLLIAVIDHGEAGTCWLRRNGPSGKCSQLFARNVTHDSCCGGGGGKGFSEKDISDVGLFFINAFNDGMACASCLDTCDRAKCGVDKRCVMRHNRPKCICAPACTKQLHKGPKRKGKGDQEHHPLLAGSGHHHHHQQQPHQQNIKVINLSESQRNRRQYFADDGGRRRAPFAVSARQLRFTDTRPRPPAAPVGKGVVKKKKSSDLSDHPSQRGTGSAGPKHNLLESVTLASSSSSSSKGSSSSASSIIRSQSQTRAPAPNCTSATQPAAGCSAVPPTTHWSDGDRVVLLHPPEPTKRSPSSTTPRRHRKKALQAVPAVAGNQTATVTVAPSHRPAPTPFVAFGKPKLLRPPKDPKAQGFRKRNRTAMVRVARREPQYVDDLFVVDSHVRRRDPWLPPSQPVDDYWGNEITHHTGFYNPVCGSDGKTYKTECQLKKRACRQELPSLMVAYKGHCQTSCKFVNCPDDKRCIEDQNAAPHCVSCGTVAECRTADRSPKATVCGTDGLTYPNVCELKRQACLIGRAIPVAYRGRCNEAATCDTIKCKDRQHCLTDLKTHKPRCVSCSYKCPRMKRQQQSNGKPFRNAKNKHLQEPPNVKLCGTNNRTYHSRCHMLKDSCNTGFYIDVQYSGTCAFGR
ncbi:uncharacterized protein LOC131215540 [Anopheles bellator]|uniref:uncharacterized protein LOC131215540 n=1 Tax=Anopheles bellator TaxID=139047 RepID=UPI002648F012|nr:uncharacterized protein LOC131215540 [Anopheles bellator]